MSFKYTGPWDVILQPQFVEETQFGVIPNSPEFTHTGPLVELTYNIEPGSLEYRQIGTRDINSMIRTGESYSFDITFFPINITLMKYGIDLPSGTGTIERSLSFIMSQKINNVENYIMFKGSRADSIDINISSDSAVECSMSFLCADITTPATSHGLNSPDFHDGGVVGTPWTNITPGADPLTYDGNVTDTNSFSVSVSNNLEVIKPNGMISAKAVEPTLRNIEWEFTTWLKDNVLIANTKTLTPKNMEYKISDSHKLVFVDAYAESITTSNTTTATEHQTLSVSGRAKSVSLAVIE